MRLDGLILFFVIIIEETRVLNIWSDSVPLGVRYADVEFIGFRVPFDVNNIAGIAFQTCPAYSLSTQHLSLVPMEPSVKEIYGYRELLCEY